MKIGLLSDTHGSLDPKVFSYFEACDEIWHAGDIGTVSVFEQLESFKPMRAVYGNIDGADIRARCPKDLHFECEGCLVWITHIGGYPPRYNREVKPQLVGSPPDLFICGHSHILKIGRDPALSNMLYINPGAAGVYGFHKIKTLVRFEIDQGICRDLQVIELGPRGKITSKKEQ